MEATLDIKPAGAATTEAVTGIPAAPEEEAAQDDHPPNWAGIRADTAAQSSVPIDNNTIFNDEIRRQGRHARYS